MNPFTDIINKFQTSLPTVRNWIDELLNANRDNAIPVIDFDFPKIKQVFPPELLRKAKVVSVISRVPFPPLSRIGLHELAEMEHMNMAGITYKDTFFINQAYNTESLHFHELVHVVQWERLGIDNFLLAYGVGLMQFGYKNSPLEQMAYLLQRRFDSGDLPPLITNLIQQQTDIIWNQVTLLLG